MLSKLKLRKGVLRKCARMVIALRYGRLFRQSRTEALRGLQPRRILVLNGAHIGDMIVSSSLLPVLRSAFRSAEIGFVAGRWGASVIRGQKDVSAVHIVDHWWHNRGQKSLLQKFLQYRRTRKRAMAEIRAAKYDLALCIYPYLFPDFMNLAWKAGIPVRIGFKESIYAPLATVAVDLPKGPFVHQGAIQAEVLRPLGVSPAHLNKRKPTLPESSPKAIAEVCQLLGVSELSEVSYEIIHIGTGARNREKSPAFWKEIAKAVAKERLVLFTGQGEREAMLIGEVMDGLTNCVNGCNRLSWDGFVAAVRHAQRLYGVESMAGHVAGTVDTPAVLVYSGMAGVARWRPEGPVMVMTNHLECAPCHLPGGCKSMECINGIRPEDLISVTILEAQGTTT